MPMKISLALGPRQPLSRQTAWGCFTSNLALPGSGSLLAGQRSGYGQVVLAIGGMIVTTVLGARFVLWCIANWSRLHDPNADQLSTLSDMWLVLRWPLLGLAVFLLGWLWALATSLQILRSAKAPERAGPPPRLD
jgi:hypothetical protein